MALLSCVHHNKKLSSLVSYSESVDSGVYKYVENLEENGKVWMLYMCVCIEHVPVCIACIRPIELGTLTG